MMRYCQRCVIPDTKPHATFDDEGVCGACHAHDKKNHAESGIDWAARAARFREIVAEAKARRAQRFDALVPVSGGKDSISQVHRLYEVDPGTRVCAVNVDYGIKTDVGRRNLDRIADMGAHLITYRPPLATHKKLIRIGLEDFGDPDLMSHTLLHAYPLHAAVALGVPLVLNGENSAFEYGGADDVASAEGMTRAWFDKYAANNGRDASFVSREYGVPRDDLAYYDYPDGLEEAGVRSAFMSQFFHWDSEEHLRIARGHGFESLDGPSEGTYRDYVGIDEVIHRLHQYLKVLKFGYGRATDHACEDVRNGRITRDEAIHLVARHDLQPLSDAVADACAAFLGYERPRFDELVEGYRNTDIWRREGGAWTIPGHIATGAER